MLFYFSSRKKPYNRDDCFKQRKNSHEVSDSNAFHKTNNSYSFMVLQVHTLNLARKDSTFKDRGNYVIHRTLELTTHVPTNVGKHVTPNDACMHCQQYAKKKKFSLDWSKLSCALQHYVTFYLSHDKTSFQMVRQTSFRNVNSISKMVP